MAAKKDFPDLGFVEETESWRLLSHFFPSKVGGKPAWLSLKPVPRPVDVTCAKCGKPCHFLLQIYAPIEGQESCFHRTIFIFVCRDPRCCKPNSNGNFVVFRSQLPRANAFYDFEAPTEDKFNPKGDHPRLESHEPACIVCGCCGTKRCAKCQKVNYCSREHQTIDWKAGHKTHCKNGSTATVDHSNYLFHEFEIVIEEEQITEEELTEKSESDKMKEYENLIASKGTGTLEGVTGAVEGDLEKMAKTETVDDKVFKQFKKRIAQEPGQVLRYDRNGTPLWVSSANMPGKGDVTPCTCGAARTFEFQVMPQLLNFLELDELDDSIDWGTLVIYTCSESCEIGSNYSKEFLWKQDFANTDVV